MSDHSTLTGANLHRPFHYEQTTDPGAVTVGDWWADTANHRIRRRTSTGWATYGGSGGSGSVDTYTVVPPGTNWAGLLALVAAANAGDTIVLANETIEQTSTLIIEKNLTIMGDPGGFSKIHLTSDVTYLGSAVQIHIAHWAPGSISVGLHNFTVEQVRPGVYRSTVITLSNNCDGIEISGCTFLGVTSNVVNMQAYYASGGSPDTAVYKNILFHDNIVNEWWESVVIIAAGGLDGLWVYNNYCTATNGPPGWSPPYGVALDVEDSYGVIKNCVIDGNHFEFIWNGSGGFSFSLGFVQSVSYARGPVSYQGIAVTNNNFIGFDMGISIRAVNTMPDTPSSITIQGNYVENSLTAQSTAAIRIWPSNESGGGGNPKGSPLDYLAFLNNEVASFNEFGIQYHEDLATYAPDLLVIDQGNTFHEPATALDLTTGLTAFWSLEEASGTRVDTPGTDDLNSVNTVGQAASVITGTFAAQFNSASSRYLVTGSSPALSRIAANSLQVMCWIYLDSVGSDMRICGQGEPFTDHNYAWSLMVLASGKVRFEADSNGSGSYPSQMMNVDSNETLVAGRWYCVFGWWASESRKICVRINNYPPKREDKLDGAGGSTAPFAVGAKLTTGSPSTFFNGRIDQLAFYRDRHLTQLEMDAFYNGGGGLTYAEMTTPLNAIKHKLSSFWELQEASGNRADSHGSNTLTDVNTVTSATGVVGNAAQFTHANVESLTIASTASLQPTADGFSISCWFYADVVANVYVATKWGTGTLSQWALVVDSAGDGFAHLFFYIGDGSGTSVSADSWINPFSPASWHHAVGVYNPVDKKAHLYLDNVIHSSKILTNGLNLTGTAAFKLGDGPDAGYEFGGRIDQVGYWQRQLRPDEITWLYNSGAGRSYAAMP